EFRRRGDLEAAALLHERLHHAPVGIRLDGVVRAHARHGRAEAACLFAHDGGIQYQEWPQVFLAGRLADDLEIEARLGMRIEKLFLRYCAQPAVASNAIRAYAHPRLLANP